MQKSGRGFSVSKYKFQLSLNKFSHFLDLHKAFLAFDTTNDTVSLKKIGTSKLVNEFDGNDFMLHAIWLSNCSSPAISILAPLRWSLILLCAIFFKIVQYFRNCCQSRCCSSNDNPGFHGKQSDLPG